MNTNNGPVAKRGGCAHEAVAGDCRAKARSTRARSFQSHKE